MWEQYFLTFLCALDVTFSSVDTDFKSVTVCADGSVTPIHCEDETFISLKNIFSPGECENGCHSEIHETISENCSNKNSCTLQPSSLFPSGCNLSIRRLVVSFECYSIFSYTDYTDRKLICGNELLSIRCSFWYQFLYINDIVYWEDNSCSECSESLLLKYLRKNCHYRSCETPVQPNECLFHPINVEIEYSCEEQKTANDSSTTPLVIATKGTPPVLLTSTKTEEFSTTLLPSDTSLPTVWLDRNNRVLVDDPSTNLTVSICATEWDSNDASVICKFLNISSAGQEAFASYEPFYQIAPVAIICNGNESTPFECGLRNIEGTCNTSHVAAVKCCTEENCSSNTSSSSKESTRKSTIGVAVGTTIGVIVIICLSIGITCFLKRTNRCSGQKPSKSIKSKGVDDYTGNQSIALPTYSSDDKDKHDLSANYYSIENHLENHNDNNVSKSNNFPHSYVTLDPDQTGYNRTKNGQNVHTKHEDKREEWKDVYEYAIGDVYDVTNKNRHKIKEQNVYSHAVDTVYDHTEQCRNAKMNEDTYDHCFGQTTEDDYNLSTRT